MPTPLNDCGCCEGISALIPEPLFNRPGLSQVAYRIGTHADFLESAFAALSDPQFGALRSLTTRDPDDFTIALLDGWATLADVLTFYQARIANEFWLRTATERDSILRLAQLIGYRLRPGVAAQTPLSLLLDETPGAPTEVTVEIGTKVQSVPGAGEKAQTFETSANITAYAAWNAITPLLSKTQNLVTGINDLYLSGTDTGLKVGDVVMVTSTVYNGAAHVLKIKVDNIKKLTHVTFDKGIPSLGGVPGSIGIIMWGDQKIPFNATAIRQEVLQKTWKDSDLNVFLQANEWDPQTLMDYLSQYRANNPSTVGYAYALRTRLGIFGNNAPKYETLPASQRFGEWVADDPSNKHTRHFKPAAYGSSWEPCDITTDSQGGNTDNSGFYLDRSVPAVQPGPGRYVVLENSEGLSVYPITGVAETSLSDYGMSAKVTKLSVSVPLDAPALNKFKVRGTTAYVQSEPLGLAELPLTTQLAQGATELDLNGFFLGLAVGQPVILSGERTDADNLTLSEVLFIKEINHNYGLTTLTFETGLTHPYKRETVTINANVAPSTHGETVSEILGSGDASQPNQSFKLRQPPLTYIRSTAPGGAESTLQLRVNDLLWHEVSTFFDRGSRERIFTTELADDGTVTVRCGDGIRGARWPSGQSNVKATYRKGIGLDGLVKAGQLTTLLTRPPGLKSAINALAAEGADDPESFANAQQNAPLTVLTLDRVVSLEDYESFSRAYAGIAKALATWTWDGRTRGVFITVAGPLGAEVSDTLAQDLITAIHNAGDPFVPVLVAAYVQAHFKLAGKIKIDPDYETEKALAAANDTLRDTFSFANRQFGQPVALSEVIALVQAVAGVVAVDIDTLYRVGKPVTLNARLEAELPTGGDPASLGAAELLTLDPAPIDLEVMP
jgi:hypothetical protein